MTTEKLEDQHTDMSDLLRSAMHARISKLPQMPPVGPDGDEDEEAADSLGSLPSSMGPPPSKYAAFLLHSAEPHQD